MKRDGAWRSCARWLRNCPVEGKVLVTIVIVLVPTALVCRSAILSDPLGGLAIGVLSLIVLIPVLVLIGLVSKSRKQFTQLELTAYGTAACALMAAVATSDVNPLAVIVLAPLAVLIAFMTPVGLVIVALFIGARFLGRRLVDAVARVILPKPGFCKECGYCLTGLAETRCPECGTEFEKKGDGGCDTSA